MTIGSSRFTGVGAFTAFELFDIGEATLVDAGCTACPARFLFHLLFGFDLAAHPIRASSCNAFPSV